MERGEKNGKHVTNRKGAEKAVQKFAFLVHLRNYREDLQQVASPLGWLPDSFYQLTLGSCQLPPFLWSEVRITPESSEADGYIIMVPYSGRHMLEQPRQMLAVIRKAIEFAVSKGAGIIGLGGLISPATLGGKLVANASDYCVTNGNAFTAVTIFRRLRMLITDFEGFRPTVAIVGATGSVGSLLCRLLLMERFDADYLLVGRNLRKLEKLSDELSLEMNPARIMTSNNLGDVNDADIVVLVTSDAGALLEPAHLRENCIVLDATQPRNLTRETNRDRPDVQILDGGLVSVPSLKTNKIGRLGLPHGVSFACMAETMLLALDGFNTDFSIGKPGLHHAETICKIAEKYPHLGFGLADDHWFGEPQTLQMPEMMLP